MSSETNQKTKLSNCNHEQLFKALARVEAKLATASIKDKNCVPHAIRIISDMSEHYVATDIDDIARTRLGNPGYRGWLPSEFGADKSYWEKKGVNPGKLLNDTYLNPHTGRQTGVHQTMSGVPVDTRSSAFQIMYQNFIMFPPSLHMETQAKIDEFISEEFENDIRSGRQILGPLYALERLQAIKVALQNKLMLRRTQINKELSDWIAKPVRSHRQVMEYRERLELLLSMKERANGYKFKSCDDETAINVVNAQTESERQVPFSTEQARLDMARLLSQMNREIELGNDIDLNLLLTRLGNIFPPQDDPAEDTSLHSAMFASASRVPPPQRRGEPKASSADIGNDKSFRGKRKQDARDSDSADPPMLERILRSLNDVKSEVGGFRKILLDNGLLTEDPAPSTKQRHAAAGKENAQEPKPRAQRQEKCAAADSDSEAEECAAIASVKKAPPRVDYRAMNAQFCNDMQYGGWRKNQSANEDEVRFSALASMCLADDDLAGSQLCPGTPSSPPRDKVVINPLSLYSSFLGFQAQHASSGHDKIIISALRNFQDDEPKEREEHSSPSFFDKGILQPTEVEADNEPKVETTPPVKRVTRSKARKPAFVIPASYEPPSDDDSDPEGNLPVPDAAATVAAPAARSKRAGSKSTPSTAVPRRGRTSTSTAVVAANSRFSWDVTEDHSPPAMVSRSTPKSTGSN